jgi:DNA helicase II / ATP-dependent DNA helicase PcrA
VKYTLDLHIHSKYSRACSKALNLPTIAKTCEIRGIDICVTGDFTHPAWMKHIEEELEEESGGVYQIQNCKTKFILGTEVSVIKKDKGKTRRVHHLVFAPSIAVAKQFNQVLIDRGCNLRSDGRPILGLTSKELLQIINSVDERMILIPAHAWTPWFGIFGTNGGYDSLEEAFDELAPQIFAIETGLSSDPIMNRRCGWLDHVQLISSSDAHSPQKLGREATVVTLNGDVTYERIFSAIRAGDVSTIEFFPEEGKYHVDGHAACKFSCLPEETKKYGGLCPKCKKPLIRGVLYRIEELATCDDECAHEKTKDTFQSIVPLPEILADVFGVGVASKQVARMYDHMTATLGTEFDILLRVPLVDIEKKTDATIAKAIEHMRRGDVHVVPGYDGVFGVVKVL